MYTIRLDHTYPFLSPKLICTRLYSQPSHIAYQFGLSPQRKLQNPSHGYITELLRSTVIFLNGRTIALHFLNHMLCLFKIVFTVTLSLFIFNFNTAPHEHLSLCYQHTTCLKCVSLGQSPWPSTQCPHAIMALGRDPSYTLPESGMTFLNTLENYNPSHNSKNTINYYSSIHTLANTDL